MNHFKRLLLLARAIGVGGAILALAIAVDGALGYNLLPYFEPVKMIIFVIAVLILGEVFYQIDKSISNRKNKELD